MNVVRTHRRGGTVLLQMMKVHPLGILFYEVFQNLTNTEGLEMQKYQEDLEGRPIRSRKDIIFDTWEYVKDKVFLTPRPSLTQLKR